MGRTGYSLLFLNKKFIIISIQNDAIVHKRGNND